MNWSVNTRFSNQKIMVENGHMIFRELNIKLLTQYAISYWSVFDEYRLTLTSTYEAPVHSRLC